MGQHSITADWSELMVQAPMTAMTYYRAVCKDLDEKHGVGYAKANPDLVGQLVLASAVDFHTASLGIAAQKICQSIDNVS